MAIVGAKPRPRIILMGFGDEQAKAAKSLGDIFPTTKLVEISESGSIDQGEFDAAVVLGTPPVLASDLFVISFGSESLGHCATDDASAWHNPRMSGSSRATEFDVPEAQPSSRVMDLIRNDLVRVFRSEGQHRTLESGRSFSPLGYSMASSIEPQPFVQDQYGKVFAGAIVRYKSAASWWFLPADANIVQWTVAAVDVWRPISPEAFPDVGPWSDQVEWMTPAEQKQHLLIRDAEEKRDAAVTNAQRAIATARVAQTKAANEADIGIRKILTTQGDELVSAVQHCLEDLGFEVEDVDVARATEADRLEDLQVKTQNGTWIAIVEVKGYAKGAKAGDLAKIERFVSRYSTRTKGGTPNAKWYIVNQFMSRSASTQRADPLNSHPDDVMGFAEKGGCVIDTMDLYRLWRDVQMDRVSVAEARRQLMVGRGNWKPELPKDRDDDCLKPRSTV